MSYPANRPQANHDPEWADSAVRPRYPVHDDYSMHGDSSVRPGDRDLPWKATPQRRDQWGPQPGPLSGDVIAPHSTDVARPRNRAAAVGAPTAIGAAAAAALFGAAAFFTAGTLPIALLAGLAGLGVGGAVAGGSAYAITNGRQAERGRPQLTAPSTTGEIIDTIHRSIASTRSQIRTMRRTTFEPSVWMALDHADQLLARIDALASSDHLQAVAPSCSELLMLEGIAERYIPELLDALEDNASFLATFQGEAREITLENLAEVDEQLTVLGESVEKIERDVVEGVSRSLEVHAQFLQNRFAAHRLTPMIDIENGPQK